MAIVTRWVGLCGVLSMVLVAACDGGSSSANNGATAGVGGESATSAGAANAAAGANNAGTSNAGTSNAAGASNGNAGSGNHDGLGGTSSGGSASVAGAAGKTSGVAGAAQAGAGGTPGGGACGGARVLFLIQRSGAVFEQPAPETSYFSFLRAALVGDGSAAKPYASKLPIGAAFLFVVRKDLIALPDQCPQLSTSGPALQSDAALTNAFTENAAAHAALLAEKIKVDAPVPESIASAVASLSGVNGPRHLVLVTTGMPDTCSKFDGPCGIDTTVKAVQDAKAAGVTTHVIGLGHDGMFNYYPSPDPDAVPVTTGYEEYLQQLANAGGGKPLGPPNVEKLEDYVCNGSMPYVPTATYSATAGDAKFYQVMTATDAKTAVADILASICP